jgi:hypothetical protein
MESKTFQKGDRMAAWSLVTEEDGECQTYKCTDGKTWEECPSQEYREAMLRIEYGDELIDGVVKHVENIEKVEIR